MPETWEHWLALGVIAVMGSWALWATWRMMRAWPTKEQDDAEGDDWWPR